MSDGLEPLAGALSDRYRLERQLGQGGMARERAAEACSPSRRVAAAPLLKALGRRLLSLKRRYLRGQAAPR